VSPGERLIRLSADDDLLELRGLYLDQVRLVDEELARRKVVPVEDSVGRADVITDERDVVRPPSETLAPEVDPANALARELAYGKVT
jgi:hypothetical protein